MRDAQDWADDLLDNRPVGYQLVGRLRAIQRDALEAAAASADVVSEDYGNRPGGYPEASAANAEASIAADRIGDIIRALMPAEPDDA